MSPCRRSNHIHVDQHVYNYFENKYILTGIHCTQNIYNQIYVRQFLLSNVQCISAYQYDVIQRMLLKIRLKNSHKTC